MPSARKSCGAPDARHVVACDRPAKHKGQHAWTDADGHTCRWGRESGPSRPHAARKADGRVRVDVYLDPTEAICLEALVRNSGASKRDVIAIALMEAFGRLK